MTRSKLSLLFGMTTSLLALRCGSDGDPLFTDAGGRAGSGTSGSAGSTGGSVAGGGNGGSSGSTSVCTPDATEACTGEDDCEGTKTCLSDGSGFAECECDTAAGGDGGAPAAGGADSGAGGADAGAAGRQDASGGAPPEGGAPGGGAPAGGAPAGGAPAGGAPAGGTAGITSGGEAGEGGSGGPVSLEVTDVIDTYIDDCNRNEAHGSDELVSVDADPCVYRAFFAPAEPLAIQAGAKIESAILRLVCDNAGATVSVYAVEQAWDEATLDWNSRPDLGELQGTFSAETGVVELDLTNLVQSWVDSGTAFGVALTQTEDNGSDYVSSEAADASERPSLSITYSR